MPKAHYLPYSATHRFSTLVVDYLKGDEALSTFYTYAPNENGIAAAIEGRKKHPINRTQLHNALTTQYIGLPHKPLVAKNIALLKDESTFTICTAHQPNLATGYLYFVYKILHAIKLAQDLKQQYPQFNFIPVYYMGSEDADLDELGTFRFGDKKFVWNANGQTGAVGRMETTSLELLLTELFSKFGPPGHNLDELKSLLHEAYLNHKTVASATLYLVHCLFGKYGLLVFEPDNCAFKQHFRAVMEADLLEQVAEKLVGETIQNFAGKHYKVQANPRPINLFYLRENIRERIERKGDEWIVIGTQIRWSRAELLEELAAHPERFSPNVMLRPLYQEQCLPNIVFIGGGAEVAYWLQLRTLFDHHQMFFPAILLRQSVMWVAKKEQELLNKTGYLISDLFAPKNETTKNFITQNADKDWTVKEELKQLELLAENLAIKAKNIDPTLERSARATIAKIKHNMEVFETKMFRAEKKKLNIGLERLSRIQDALFPNGGLQERVENFMPYYLEYGVLYFDEILSAIQPLKNEFLVIQE